MKIIDDSTKKLHWWNRNYFFAATVVVVLVNIILYGTLGDDWEMKFEPIAWWYGKLNLSSMLRAIMNSFSHIDWQHVLLNMLCFFIGGLYLERKVGTLPFLALTLALTFFSALAATVMVGFYWHGFSCANFALYAYIIVDYPFVFCKSNRTKFNVIAGAVLLVLIYISCCTDGESFGWGLYNLLTNAGHYSGFIVGLVIGSGVQFTRLIAKKSTK